MNLKSVVFKIVSISFSVLVTLLIIMGLVNLGKYCYQFGYRVFTEKPVEKEPGTEVHVTVTSGMSEYEVGKLLVKKGLLRDENLFFAQLKLSAYSKKLLPGEYTLNTSMTAKEMMAVMAAPEDTEDTEEGSETVKTDTEDSTEGMRESARSGEREETSGEAGDGAAGGLRDGGEEP